MSRNQFFYSRQESSPVQIEGKEERFITYRDSFSVDKVIRSVQLSENDFIVLLDDIHQRPQDVEVKNKQGKVTAIKREMNIFQSEIHLNEADALRFYKLTNIDV